MSDKIDWDKVFFTADQHWGHENIIRYEARPFPSVLAMDEYLIRRWNEVVPEDGIVYHLGDLSLKGWAYVRAILARLNGEIRMLSNPWHHDQYWLKDKKLSLSNLYKAGYLSLLPPLVVLDIDEPEFMKDGYPRGLTLCHYPFAEWDRKHHGAWHIHGHSHGNYPGDDEPGIIDCGVDAVQYVHDYGPLPFREAARRLSQ